jgi:undecaprenyl pyrophosphate synthase
MWTTAKNIAYALYAPRLNAQPAGADLSRRVAVVMDGNRRWARQSGFTDARIGHRYGAEHLDEVLRRCAEIGIQRERRMSGFLLWQAAYSELHFTEVHRPGFRKIDFLRALRSHAARHRPFGA